MGNGPQVIDIVGFLCMQPLFKQGVPRKPDLGTLDSARNNLATFGLKNLKEGEAEGYRESLKASGLEPLDRALTAFDPDEMVITQMADMCIGEGDMAIGWDPASKPTDEMLAALQKILEDAGYELSRIAGDRFCYYG